MLTVATLLWQSNGQSRDFSRCYDESWVEKLYAGFRRNLTVPFRFVVFVDKLYSFSDGIEQHALLDPNPSYSTCIEPYRLGEPMILVGLDTIVTGNIDHLAGYCLTADKIALPRDPFKPERACNGVALVPAGNQDVYNRHRGENDMEWMRAQPHVFLDDIFPGQVVSYKGHVKKKGLRDARIVYFHGQEKAHQLGHLEWIRKHWGARRPRTALCLGGAKCVWDDIESALDIGEYDGVVACNDAGASFTGKLDAWVSLHPEKLPNWNRERLERGLPPVARFFAHDERSDRPFTMGTKTAHRFVNQRHSGSSGLFTGKVALDDLKFDQVVFCGVPMVHSEAHFFNPKEWQAARHYRKGWEEALPRIRDRARSMSGWTMKMLGLPTAAWLEGRAND